MTARADLEHSYPARHQLGTVEITLRLMIPADRAAILAFARELPESDLLFLRRDITRESEVDAWLADASEGLTRTIVAEGDGGAFAGYATVHRSHVQWSAHVAELRVLVAESMRGRGLGRLLTREAFAMALAWGIEKMVAQMTLDQKGAIATFGALGFRPEALLRDHVKDRDGTKHDLLVMSHDVAAFEPSTAGYGVMRAFI